MNITVKTGYFKTTTFESASLESAIELAAAEARTALQSHHDAIIVVTDPHNGQEHARFTIEHKVVE